MWYPKYSWPVPSLLPPSLYPMSFVCSLYQLQWNSYSCLTCHTDYLHAFGLLYLENTSSHFPCPIWNIYLWTPTCLLGLHPSLGSTQAPSLVDSCPLYILWVQLGLISYVTLTRYYRVSIYLVTWHSKCDCENFPGYISPSICKVSTMSPLVCRPYPICWLSD